MILTAQLETKWLWVRGRLSLRPKDLRLAQAGTKVRIRPSHGHIAEI